MWKAHDKYIHQSNNYLLSYLDRITKKKKKNYPRLSTIHKSQNLERKPLGEIEDDLFLLP